MCAEFTGKAIKNYIILKKKSNCNLYMQDSTLLYIYRNIININFYNSLQLVFAILLQQGF